MPLSIEHVRAYFPVPTHVIERITRHLTHDTLKTDRGTRSALT